MGISSAFSGATAAMEYQRAMYKAQKAEIELQFEMYRRWPAPKPAKHSKCPSCGSREFRHHNMVRICSYCRSEA